MSCALDRNTELALLTAVETSLCTRLDLPVNVYESLQSFDVFVVKVRRDIFLESSCHNVLASLANETKLRFFSSRGVAE